MLYRKIFNKNVHPQNDILHLPFDKLRADQSSGKLTEGIVKDILTSFREHPYGIKVRLASGQVGRVKEIKA